MSAPRLFVLFFYFIFVFLNSQLQWLYIYQKGGLNNNSYLVFSHKIYT